MTFSTRLTLFALVAGIVWYAMLHSARDVTDLAVRQFDDGNAAERLQQATLAQSYGPLVGPAVLVLLGVVMFWDDIERLCKSGE